MFHPGMKFHLKDEIFAFLHVIVICFLYQKQWQGEMKFQLGCVIIISSLDIISPLKRSS